MEKETKYTDKISNMFSSIHKRYDFFNHLLSLGADYWWRHRLVNSFTIGKTNKVLDMAAGTLDVSIAIAKKYPEAQIIAADICEEMLLIGEEKVRNIAQKKREKKECCVCKNMRVFLEKLLTCAQEKKAQDGGNIQNSVQDCKIALGIDKQIKIQVMDAQSIPLEEASFDVCTIAFGIRNVENRLKALEEMHRVLVTGGQLCILEFAPVHTPVLGMVYHFYLEKIMPKLVKLFIGEEDSYKYLAKSIKEFPLQSDFVKIIKEAGFSFVRYEKLSFGLVSLYIAIKSDSQEPISQVLPDNHRKNMDTEKNMSMLNDVLSESKNMDTPLNVPLLAKGTSKKKIVTKASSTKTTSSNTSSTKKETGAKEVKPRTTKSSSSRKTTK